MKKTRCGLGSARLGSRLLLPIALCAGVAVLANARPARGASNELTIEAVGKYDACGNSDLNPTAEDDSDGFEDGMKPPGSSTWTTHSHWYDPNVWDTDFLDPDKTGNGDDNDSSEFDAASTGIAWYDDHGACPLQPDEHCATGADCNDPPPGLSLPGACKNEKPTVQVCAYYYPRQLKVCGSNDKHGGYVNLTNSARWGESTDSGGWAGAGTNGGANMDILNASCSVEPSMYWQMLGPTFAGLHIMAVLMPVSGDTIMASNRGSTFAGIWQSGDDSQDSPAAAWLDAEASVRGGLPCAFGGGGHGMNGCGVYVVMAVDHDQASATWHLNTESWLGLRSDSNDSTGNGGWHMYGRCNYD